MRLFGILCFAVALFYAWTAVDIVRSGVATPLAGNTSVEHRRDDPGSRYQRYLLARCLLAGGFVALGTVMHWVAGKFETLDSDASR